MTAPQPEVPTEDAPIAEIPLEECWELLAGQPVGRLAYHLVDEVHVVPVNYAVDDGPAGRRLVVLTAPGNKLLAAELGSEAALQIDWFGEDEAWSVLARGQTRHLGEDEEGIPDRLDLRPWVPVPRYDVIELAPRTVSGRRFMLRRG